jgi:hypothetical protein
MFARILTFSLAHRWTVLLGVLVLIAAGCWVVYTISVAAFPDLTNNQVVIVTEAPSMPPRKSSSLLLVGGIAALWIFHLNLNLSASLGFIALLAVAVLNGCSARQLHQPIERRRRLATPCSPARSRPPFETGTDDSPCRQSRIRSYGYLHFNWSRGPAALGDSRDWRTDQFNFAYFIFVAHILRLVR